MKLHTFTLFALSSSLALTGCGTPEGYPSLSTRDSERVSGTFDAPSSSTDLATAPQFTPAPPAGETIAQLRDLASAAGDAHQGFLLAAQEARNRVTQASNAAVGSVSWSRAQVEIASLETFRGNALIALADIDQLYVDAALRGGELTQIEAARAQASALVSEQNAMIESMLSALAQ